jgi:hypothetical protein
VAQEQDQGGDPPDEGGPIDQHGEIGAALDRIEASLDEVADALARMA